VSSFGDAGYITNVNATSNQIKFYNADYSLYKNINIVPVNGYNMTGATFFSKRLYNDDNKVEFIVSFLRVQDGTVINNIKLYNEDGIILKDFGEGTEMSVIIFLLNEQYKLFVFKNNITEIYSLPGTISTGVSDKKITEYQSPYPNPTNATITLPYQLGQGETSAMNIYNINGQLIETKQIDYIFDKILLNVSAYPKGIYIYEVNGVSKQFIVE
jgi:hypothetical protein